MEAPLLLQFLIALFTGMVVATFVPPVRRSIPRPVEVLLWVALIFVCSLGVLSVTDANARELSASAVWGADQMINALAGLTVGGVLTWVSDNRFAIASWMAITSGAGIFVLLLLRSQRAGRAWQPRVRLREWMEMPVLAMVPEPVPARYPLGGLNHRIAAGGAIAGTTMLSALLDLSIWVRDVMMPRERTRFARVARASRIQSSSSLESLRDVAAHLHYAASAWYAAAGQPAVNEAVQHLRPVTTKAGRVIEIQTGWYGPTLAAPTTPGEDESDEAESKRANRLAS